MNPTYFDELSWLQETYRTASHLDVSGLADLHTSAAGQPTLFVASGGGLAVAQVAADQHVAAHGEVASAMTPLALVGEATVRRAGVVVISARAAHPDVAFALRAARTRHNYPISLVTHRRSDELEASLLDKLTSVVTVPASLRDGFLATNSVLSLATLFVRAANPELTLPPVLPHLTTDPPELGTDRCLILHGPGQRSVAVDLETRLSETGLATVQVADYRNFAHGRHTGYARHLADTTVVAFASPGSERLAEATLALLPDEARVSRVYSSLPDRIACLDLLAASMRLVGVAATRSGMNPARPKVPAFGRKLYHLGAQRYIGLESIGPIERKLAAIGTQHSDVLRRQYAKSLSEWVASASQTDFRGVVIDYDGTVCETTQRFDLPPESVREQLIRLLSDGMHIGFASGRGRSLHTDLRQWVPRSLWPNITVGLYNGALIVDGLDQSVPAKAVDGSALHALLGRLEREPLADLVKIEARPWQLSIEPVTGAGIGVETVAQWVIERMAIPPALNLKLVRSGHSVDVVDVTTSKVDVLRSVEHKVEGTCMAIGDRGDVGGNDFELLASQAWTLSVDRCSGDQSRCWNLSAGGVSGPSALVAYLRRLRRSRDHWRFRYTDS